MVDFLTVEIVVDDSEEVQTLLDRLDEYGKFVVVREDDHTNNPREWREFHGAIPMDCGCIPHLTYMTEWGFHCETENQGYCNFECPHEDEDE